MSQLDAFLEDIRAISMSFIELSDSYEIITRDYHSFFAVLKNHGMEFRVRDSKMRGDAKRIMWENQSIGYCGTPFVVYRRIYLRCEYGSPYHSIGRPDENERYVEKKKRQRSSKKIGCPASMKIINAKYFPKFEVSPDTTDYKKLKMLKILRQELLSSRVQSEDRFIITMSKPSAHCHDIWNTGLMKKKRLRKKLADGEFEIQQVEEVIPLGTKESLLDGIAGDSYVIVEENGDESDCNFPILETEQIVMKQDSVVSDGFTFLQGIDDYSPENEIGKGVPETDSTNLPEPENTCDPSTALRFVDMIRSNSLMFEERLSGYFLSTDDFEAIFRILGLFGMHFIIRSSSKLPEDAGDFGKIFWSTSCVPFFGYPFKIKETRYLLCSLGPSHCGPPVPPEERIRQRAPSKKGRCLATAKILHTTIFPDYGVTDEGTMTVYRKNVKSKQLRLALKKSDVPVEDRYFIWFSKPEVHSHPVCTSSIAKMKVLDGSYESDSNLIDLPELLPPSKCSPIHEAMNDLETDDSESHSSNDSITVDELIALAENVAHLCSALPSDVDVTSVVGSLTFAESQLKQILSSLT